MSLKRNSKENVGFILVFAAMYLVKRFFQDLAHIGYTFKNEGFKTGIVQLADVVRKIAFSKVTYCLMAHDLDLSHMNSKRSTRSNLVIRKIQSHEDIESLSSLGGLSDFIPDPINWMKKVFDDGGVGFIAFQNNQPAGCDWISFKIATDLMRVPIPLKPGDAYLHALFVTRDKRHIGCGHMLGMHLLNYLKENGYKRGIINVLKNNTIALTRANKKLGYKIIGEIIHTRILLWDFYKYF